MAPHRPKHQKKAPATGPATFNEASLTKLTAKIGQNLANPTDKLANGKRKRDDAGDKSSSAKRRQPGPESSPRPKKPEAAGQNDGVKDKKAMILEEIKALGGDEEDLDLIAGIDSDAEEGAPKKANKEQPVDAGFAAELAKFASGLGFEKYRDEAEIDEEEVDGGNAEEDLEEEDEDVEEEEEDEQEEEDEESEEEAPALVEERAPVKVAEKPQARKKGNLIFEPRPDWHGIDEEGLPSPKSNDISSCSSAVASLKAYAKTLLEEDAAAYRSATSSSSTHKFMSTIMASGTMSDKVSALTLEIQESPVHNIKAFESLINLAGKKSRGQAIAALSALVDLLGNGVVLPSDRRLRPFHAQPGLLGTLQKKSVQRWDQNQPLPGKITKSHLMMWIFEDWLKESYFKIIQLLEVWSSDEIEYSRSRSLDFIYGLLKDKPEQEANLLRLVVHKLGDRERKIASRASYLLLQLLNTHPGMKPIVVQSIEQEILLRPGEALRPIYYAINTLNQTILSQKEPAVADNLIRIYFELFLSLLKSGALGDIEIGAAAKPAENEKDTKRPRGRGKPPPKKPKVELNERDTAEKLVSAVLTGVNRAIPFSVADESSLEKHLDTLFKITHSSNFNTSIQALMLIQQMAASKHVAVDRFFRTLYESLLDPRLITSSKQALYLNLLYRSLKNDIDVRRIKAFVKRMLQVLNLHQPSFICGILYLIVELEGTFPDLKTLLNEPEDNEGDEDEVYKDVVSDAEDGAQPTEPVQKSKFAYDGRKRDPEYSNAQRSCLWELIPYFEHFHPTVSAFASNLLVRQKSLPKPDLANHTLMHFLDKFVYRNPKSTDTQRGASIMQPTLATGNAAHLVSSGKVASKHQSAVNTADFWNKKSEDVAAEDVFFHEYFSHIGKSAQESKKKAKKEAAAEDDEADSDAGEEEIWEALVNSRPGVQRDEDGDVDISDDDSDLGSLLEMSDDSDDDDDEMLEGDDAAGSDGGVEFFDFSGEEDDDEDNGGVLLGPAGKPEEGKGGKLSDKRKRKKELKAMPMFASAEDYAAMVDADDDEDF